MSRHVAPHAMPLRDGWRSDTGSAWLLAAMLWALVVLMVVPEGLDYVQLAGDGAPTSAGAVSRMLWMGLLAFAVAAIAWRTTLAFALLRRLNVFLLLMVALAVASVAWSIDPMLSTRRVYRLVTIVAVCTAFVLYGWHAARCQAVLRPVVTALLLGSLAFGLTFPALAIHAEAAPELAGAWRGLANHKNGLGALAGIGLVLWAHAGLARQSRALPVLLGLGASAACLLLSRSSTATVAAGFGVAFLVMALHTPPWLRRWLPWATVGLALAMLLVTLGVLGLLPGASVLLAPVTAFTDKDGSLTGRTEIWAVLFDHIRLRPLLGSGYSAYWTALPTPGTESHAFVERMAGFYPGSGHNGILDVVNDLGFVGLGGLLGYAVVHLQQSLRLLRIEPAQAALWLALFFQQVITNLSESHWFAVLSVDLVFMTAASAALARGLLQQRFVARFGPPRRVAQPMPHADVVVG